MLLAFELSEVLNEGELTVPHPHKTSQIAALIEKDLEKLPVPDTDLGQNPCQTANTACILAPGIEHLFVWKTANYLVARIQK
jgi:hypothetical protein